MVDSQLLERFVVRNDAAAFRDLVDRHGPAVLRTCLSYLHDPHEAEDALQATFLILLKKAPSIRDPELLNGWLVGVARRVASRSRRRAVDRSERERRWAETHPESIDPGDPWNDTRRVVREEIGRLPEVSRRSLALCYLEGLSHEQAARRLDWPLGTLKVRLVRARRQLRDRLDRRGVALGVALLLLLRRRGETASLEAAVDSTTRAITLAAHGRLAALEASFPRACRMARAFRRPGFAAHWGTASLFVLAFLFLFSCGIALAHRVKSIQDESVLASARLAKVLDVDCR